MKRLIVLLVLVLFACQRNESSATSLPITPFSTLNPTVVVATPLVEISASPTEMIAPTATSSPTATPYEQYIIDNLRGRTYGGGNIEIVKTLEDNNLFTRYLIRYPSDGLAIYGFANVPKGDGPFPVIIGIHGLVEPTTYQTLDYTTPALDLITQAGYIVIHPNLRGYPPSDNGDNLFRVGMSLDVLNLMALIKSKSGSSELLGKVLPEDIGLWGYSMGGDIVLRVLTVSSDAKAAVLYSSISGDEIKNAQLLSKASADAIFQTELAVSPSIVDRISPATYYHYIKTPIQLYHGTADQTVPIGTAQETCNALTAAGVQVNCIYYPEEDHTFRSRVMDRFYGSMFGFYKKYLSP